MSDQIDGNPYIIPKHMESYERKLLESYRVSQIAQHKIHKGSAREIFIKNFLEEHIPDIIGIGTGEIISFLSKNVVEHHRPQNDIVLYRRNFPKLTIAEGINCFLAESVVATIEVKSIIDDKAIKQAVRNAVAIKDLPRYKKIEEISSSDYYYPPSIQNYVFGYSSSSSLEQIASWIHSENCQHYQNYEEQIAKVNFPKTPFTSSPSIDGLYLLNSGSIEYIEFPYYHIKGNNLDDLKGKIWQIVKAENVSLLLFFLRLITSISGIVNIPIKTLSNYIKEINAEVSMF